MKEKFKSFLEKSKTLWGGLTKIAKIVICSALGVFLIGAIVLTVFLNSSTEEEWIVLFPDMSQEESMEVLTVLKNRGVETQMNEDSEIQVRPEEWDALVYDLAQMGYPQSAPSYGTFFDNLGMTMTEFEKQQALRFELQDRLQTTIQRIEGVKSAIVTINIPEKSKYAWEEDEDKHATASVTLTLENNAGFQPESVSAVKKLVAYSAQQMTPDDVTVINAMTGQEMQSAEQVAANTDTEELDMETKMEYANIYKAMYEANAEEVLSSIYPDGVTAVAVVELDYDKIVQESKEHLTDEDGNSVKSHEEIHYDTELGEVEEGGVVGEEQNDDIPNYQYDADQPLNSGNTNDYHHTIDWIEPGYRITQTEVAIGAVKDASISVVVTNNSGYISADERNMLVELVRTATNINPDKITVYAKDMGGELIDGVVGADEDSFEARWGIDKKKFIILIVLCGFVVLAVVLIIVFMIVKSMRKKMEKQQEENDEAMAILQEQIEENNRKSLEEAAEEHNKVEKAAEIEVREFAKNNPEVAAALIRSMLKERDE